MIRDPIVYSCVADIKLDELTNDHYIEFDDNLMRNLNWHVGDTIQWVDNRDGTYTLRKKNEEFQ